MNELINMLKLQQIARPSATNANRLRNSSANEPADLHGLQQQRLSEISDRMFQNERLGPQGADELKALKGLFMRKQDEIRNGIVEQQRPIVDARMADIRQAQSQGFGGVNPTAEQFTDQRAFDREKMNVPIEQARVAGRYDVEQAGVTGRAMVDQARQYGENQLGVQDKIHDEARAYREYMYPKDPNNPTGPPLGMDGARPSFNAKTGAVGGTPAPRQANLSPLLNQFAISQRNLGGADPWDDNNATLPAVQEHRNRWAGILAQHGAGSDVKQDVQKILRDPRLRALPVEELIDINTDPPDYVAELRELLALARGGY